MILDFDARALQVLVNTWTSQGVSSNQVTQSLQKLLQLTQSQTTLLTVEISIQNKSIALLTD